FLPENVRIKDPAVIETGGLGLPCERYDTLGLHIRLQSESKFKHAVPPVLRSVLLPIPSRVRRTIPVADLERIAIHCALPGSRRDSGPRQSLLLYRGILRR